MENENVNEGFGERKIGLEVRRRAGIYTYLHARYHYLSLHFVLLSNLLPGESIVASESLQMRLQGRIPSDPAYEMRKAFPKQINECLV
jgi:hypothetical protein